LKKALVSLSTTILLATSSIPAQAQENLIYVPVSPCRIVDTRPGQGGEGAISAGTSRRFLVSGAVSSQGGTSAGCPAPRPGSPLAVSAYVTAVPLSGSIAGALAAFPSDESAPAAGEGATVNFAAGQVIGNTTNITLCEPDTCPTTGDTGEFAVLARNSIQHVVVDVQGYFYPAAGTCPDDMVAAGSVCVDKYEASVWDTAAGGGTQFGDGTDDYPCLDDGSDCGDGTATPIYAISQAGVNPSVSITWYQAAQACANVAKRLPTTAEWQMAASGTPSGLNSDPLLGCNTNSGTVSATDAFDTLCQSTVGASSMVGNAFELVAELDADFVAPSSSVSFVGSDSLNARAFGADFVNSGSLAADTESTLILDGPLITAASVGFRCVR